MTLSLLAAALAAAAAHDSLAVVAADAAPASAPRLVEMTHQLRAACRERDASVQDLRETRARLLGDRATASLQELERAYAGAMLTASHGDAAAAARTMRGIVEELERAPDGEDAFALWTRAQLRLAHLELAAGRQREYREALERMAEVHPRVRADADQFSPTFRRDLEAARARVAARPQHALRVASDGASAQPVAVFVDGRPVGAAPVALQVGAGRHRVSGAAGALRVPTVQVEVGADGADVTLEAKLAAAVDVNAGPALGAVRPDREAAVVKLGAWVEASRVLVASVAIDSGATFLVGSLYDVGRGALLREGRVRTAAGLASPEHVNALAAFLLTGQPSPAIVTAAPAAKPLRVAPAASLTIAPTAQQVAPRARAAWMRPAAIASGAAALGAGVFTLQQLSAARSAASAADSLVRSDGTYVGDAGAWSRHRAEADSARRNVWIGAAGTAVFAATAGVLGYLSWDRGAPVVRF